MMPDISMCDNSKCEASATCYRFNAVPNPYRQSYGVFGTTDYKQCEYYYKLREDKDNDDS